MYECDGNTHCKNKVDTGNSNPSLVLCADCNHGTAAWNCIDEGNYSCNCSICEPVTDEFLDQLAARYKEIRAQQMEPTAEVLLDLTYDHRLSCECAGCNPCHACEMGTGIHCC